jgi:hypothetical protein
MFISAYQFKILNLLLNLRLSRVQENWTAMRLPVKLICRSHRLHPDGTCSVFIQYCFNQKQRPIFFTGIKIPSHYWNVSKGEIFNLLPPANGNYKKMNNELFRLKRLFEDLILYATEINIEDIATYAKQHFSITLNSASFENIAKEQKIELIKKEKAKEDIYY